MGHGMEAKQKGKNPHPFSTHLTPRADSTIITSISVDPDGVWMICTNEILCQKRFIFKMHVGMVFLGVTTSEED